MADINPLDLLDQITSGGYTSKKLDAYMRMREMVARQIGDAAAPIMTPPQLREHLLVALKKEIARSYRNPTSSMAAMAALFYGVKVDTVMGISTAQMAEFVHTHPGTDFGIKDLDALGTLFATVMRKNLPVIGNMLMYEAAARPVCPLVELIRELGGTVTDEMIARAKV